MNNWKKVWNKEERVTNAILDMLIKVNGFDSPTATLCIDDWLDYTNKLYARIGIEKNDSVFDVGCGSGAFIYPLFLRGHRVGGIDYSKVLTNILKIIIPDNLFLTKEAIRYG